MDSYERMVKAYHRGHREGRAEAEAEIQRLLYIERAEAYNRGFRDGKGFVEDNVRRALDE